MTLLRVGTACIRFACHSDSFLLSARRIRSEETAVVQPRRALSRSSSHQDWHPLQLLEPTRNWNRRSVECQRLFLCSTGVGTCPGRLLSPCPLQTARQLLHLAQNGFLPRCSQHSLSSATGSHDSSTLQYGTRLARTKSETSSRYGKRNNL